MEVILQSASCNWTGERVNWYRQDGKIVVLRRPVKTLVPVELTVEQFLAAYSV